MAIYIKERAQDLKINYGIESAFLFDDVEQRIDNLNAKIKKCYKEYFKQYSEKDLYERALSGDAQSQYDLADLFAKEEFELYDNVEASFWYLSAAKLGHIEAQYQIGRCYYFGKGIAQNRENAAKWYQQSAKQGHVEAQYQTGECYRVGEGVEINKSEAVKWYQLAAENGNLNAKLALGTAYFFGEGIDKNYEKAVKYLMPCADLGNESAQFLIGKHYDVGLGVKQDYQLAAYWYRRAADQGNVEAKKRIDEIYNIIEPQQAFVDKSMPIIREDNSSVIFEEPNVVRTKTIYNDWRTGEQLYYDENGRIVNSAGEEVAACWWD